MMKRTLFLILIFPMVTGFACKTRSGELPEHGICAHRGTMDTHPENTLAAFKEAAEMAGEMGKTEDYDYFIKEAENYRNLYRADKKLMWPKNADGEWIDIDPKFDGGPGGRDYFDENNGYTYAWQAQHDIHGLIELMGGREDFTANLDQLFREDLGRTKYQFWAKFAGEPWKAQKRIRFLLDTWFQDNIFGIPGDEDGGGMTAFVVFSSMGFYPVTPGLPVYNIGSPAFEEVSIKLDNGSTFTVVAKGCSRVNKYIQSARLNGSTTIHD